MKTTDTIKNSKRQAELRSRKTGSFFKSTLQAKLTINRPGDVYEQEADAAAGKVMKMPDNNNRFFKPASDLVQRKCSHCDEEEEKLQMKAASCAEGGMPASSAVNEVISSTGQPLDPITKQFMESRFDYDFGGVRIHNDSLAHRSSNDINALAYTHGNHVAFGEGQYQPSTSSGKKLLAHELMHVIQQNDSAGSINIDQQKVQRAKRKKTELELKRYAIWPYEAMPDWKRLSTDEQAQVLKFMIAKYGVDFAARFSSFASKPNPRQCVLHTTNIISESTKSLEARGYKLIDVFGGVVERWANSNCDLLYRILPSPRIPAAIPAPKVGPATKDTSIDTPPIYDVNDIDWKNPAAKHGEPIRSTRNLSSLKMQGEAVEYEDGTIIIKADDGDVHVLVPMDSADESLYVWTSSGGTATIFGWELDPDDLF